MNTEIALVADRSRYVLTVDGSPVGKALYQDDGATRTFVHTEVDPEYGGQGLGTQLVAFAVADARAAGKTVEATCPLVTAYLTKNPA
jgi:predicted GNAT family acetyltransferase